MQTTKTKEVKTTVSKETSIIFKYLLKKNKNLLKQLA